MRVPGGWRTAAVAGLALVTVAAGVVVLTGRQPSGAPTAAPTQSYLPTGPAAQTAPPVLAPVGDSGPLPTAAGLAATLQKLLHAPALGSHVGGVVADASTGQSLYGADAESGFTPASATKLFTAVAALETLGPDSRIETKVVAGATPTDIVLVGGGDATLALSAPAGFVPAPASMPALAAATAAALKVAGHTTVHLDYDTTLFTGPRTAPTWPAEYVTTGIVSPITALTVDEGRTGSMVEGSGPRVDDPPDWAAKAFVRQLKLRGITVTGAPRSVTAGSTAAKVASVQSPPIANLVQWMLTTSDNDLAEALAHLTGGAAGTGASFAGGVTAVKSSVGAVGVSLDGVQLYDGSGLTSTTSAPPRVLGQLVVAAAAADRPELRPILSGLPVAGFTGSLTDRFSAPTTRGEAGFVRAKTGTLSKVSALAGLVEDADGRVLVFVFVADQVPAGGTIEARTALDKLAAAVGGCGCRV